MLAPRPWKRTLKPCCSNGRRTSSKSFESAKTFESAPLSIMEVADLLYRALVGFECVAINRDRIREFLEEHQR